MVVYQRFVTDRARRRFEKIGDFLLAIDTFAKLRLDEKVGEVVWNHMALVLEAAEAALLADRASIVVLRYSTVAFEVETV